MSNYRNKLEEYLGTLDIKADRVLDVGGAALPVKVRVKSWDVKTYQIYDNALETPKEKVDLYVNLNDELIDGFDTFDMVFCLEVMEYIRNPKQAMVNLNYFTKPDGILYITFPFIYPVHEPKQSDCLRYTCSGVAALLADGGFKILDIVSRDMTLEGFEHYKKFMKAEGFHAARGARHDQLGWIVKCQK